MDLKTELKKIVIFICCTLFVFISASNASVRHYPIEGNILTGDDQSTSLTVSRGISIGNDTFDKVYVSTNGLVTFNKSVTAYQPALNSSYPLLAPYWTDLDKGRVYYKVYTTASELRKATTDVQKFSGITSFQAEWMLVATWNDTQFHSNSNPSVKIAVQCVVMTDYISTHIIFQYINVSTTYRGSSVGIGFNNGTLVRNPYSLTPGTYQMSTHIGNTGLFGVWFYTVTYDSNDCVSGPCENGGVCEDLYRGYRCHCSDAFTGTRCQTDIDECITLAPCFNGGSCVNNHGSFTCNCLSGWTGSMCEQGINYGDVMCNRDGICCNVSQCHSNNDTHWAKSTRKQEVSAAGVAEIVLGVLLAVVFFISVALFAIAAHFRRQRNQEQHRRIQSTYETITVSKAQEQDSPIYTNELVRSNVRE